MVNKQNLKPIEEKVKVTMSNDPPCPICNAFPITPPPTLPVPIRQFKPTEDLHRYHCAGCHNFIIDGKLVYDNSQKEWWNERHIVSAIIREYNILKNEPLVFKNDNEIMERLTNYPVPKSPKEQADRLLMLLSKEQMQPGKKIQLQFGNDYPMCYGKDHEEMAFFVDYLKEKNLIKRVGDTSHYAPVEITVDGWEYINEISKGLDSKRVFVAMWFDKRMDKFYINGYKPILEELHYEPIQMKFLQHIEKIDDKIIAEINKCRFLVADLTGIRNNVLFEAGFAFGLKKPVIWTCRNTWTKKVETIFDTRQYPYIKWKNVDELKEKLKNRIEAIMI